jgi:SAM-dependent methyltransferase
MNPLKTFLRLVRRSAPQSTGATFSALGPVTKTDADAIQRDRTAIAFRFIRGRGVEVGAGARPFPVPPDVEVLYGDIREHASLQDYFKATEVQSGQQIDAQTFAGMAESSLDFVISAHVIEHLRDPIGAIVNAVRVLKTGGFLILVVPEMRLTFDRHRPETTVEHVLLDFADAGEGTCRTAYEEHLRFVHPYLTGENYSESEIEWQAAESVKRWREFDVHFHAWTRSGFEALLAATAELAPIYIETAVSVSNENIFVLRKLSG